MKWLIKLFCPSAETLAGYAADGIQKTFNETKEDTRMKIAKYTAYSQEATRIANELSTMVADGTLDNLEKEAIQKMLTPIFEKLLALV